VVLLIRAWTIPPAPTITIAKRALCRRYIYGVYGRRAFVVRGGHIIIIVTLKIPYVYCNKKLTSMPFSLYNYRPAVTLDGDHHHPQMTGDHPLVVSRANPAAVVVQAQEIGVHRLQTLGAHHPRVRVERAVADQVNLVRAAQVQAHQIGVLLAQMIGVHLPVNLGSQAVAAVNLASLEVPHQEMVDGEAGDLILHHGDRVPAVRVARVAQAVVNRARAVVVVDQASLESQDQVDQAIGEIHVVHRLETGVHHPPRVNQARAEVVVN